MITVSDAANEILEQCILNLRANFLREEHARMALTICIEQKDNAYCREKIDEYTRLADQITDGVFSATLQSYGETKQ